MDVVLCSCYARRLACARLQALCADLLLCGTSLSLRSDSLGSAAILVAELAVADPNGCEYGSMCDRNLWA